MNHLGILAWLVGFITGTNAYATDNLTVMKGPWFGQAIPNLTPQMFAPDIISLTGRYEFGLSFSADLQALYFTTLEVQEGTVHSPQIFHSKVINGKWTKPARADFTQGKMPDELLPYAGLDNNKVYFTAKKGNAPESGIWFVNKSGGLWSEAQRLSQPLNDGALFDISQATNGDLFFTNMSERKMYFAKNEAGILSKAMPVDIEFGIHGFISPNGDYLVVNARHRADKSRRDSDLYVYFKNTDGSWSTPINLGEAVNSTYSETVPRITPDGNFLFFGRYNEPGQISNIYWVSTRVITQLKEENLNG